VLLALMLIMPCLPPLLLLLLLLPLPGTTHMKR
jgi:hypothetical protein